MNSVANVRVKDYIIKSIREQILSGGFPGGMRLAQEELAEGLLVSRIPVREALQILEEQGLVKRLPSRHMVVVEFTGRQFHQIFQTISGLQYHYGRFILESENREGFLAALSAWDGRDELSFHRLFSGWLDNVYLSRQFNNMLDTYVEYASGLPGCDGEPQTGTGVPAAGKARTIDLLLEVRTAYIRGDDLSVPGLLQQYYGMLEKNLLEERNRNSCRD